MSTVEAVLYSTPQHQMGWGGGVLDTGQPRQYSCSCTVLSTHVTPREAHGLHTVALVICTGPLQFLPSCLIAQCQTIESTNTLEELDYIYQKVKL